MLQIFLYVYYNLYKFEVEETYEPMMDQIVILLVML